MNERILVVEDDPTNMQVLCWILDDVGYDFVGVESGEAGLERLLAEPFDLVLMDISLPGIDGTEATRRMRQIPHLADVPVIAVTAHTLMGDEDALLAAGMSEVIQKPIDESRLLKSMERWLAKDPTDAPDRK